MRHITSLQIISILVLTLACKPTVKKVGSGRLLPADSLTEKDTSGSDPTPDTITDKPASTDKSDDEASNHVGDKVTVKAPADIYLPQVLPEVDERQYAVEDQNPVCKPKTIIPTISLEPGSPNDISPDQLKEEWFGHTADLSKIYENYAIVIYADAAIDRDRVLSWMPNLLTQSWNYARSHYGTFNQGKLYAFLHNDQGGGTAASYNQDAVKGRNIIDVALSTLGDPTHIGNYHMIIHEISHVIENAAFDGNVSISRTVWRDSMFAEAFIWDILDGIGCEGLARNAETEAFPSGWFMKFFMPMMREDRNFLSTYFGILKAHFPKGPDGKNYKRFMNAGEYVFFNSLAAGVDLRSVAEDAGFYNASQQNGEWDAAVKEFSHLKIEKNRSILNVGDYLVAGQSLTSDNRKYNLTMRFDNNLALTDESNKEIWSSKTMRTKAMMATILSNGNFVVLDTKPSPVWSSGTSNIINKNAKLVLADDGKLKLMVGSRIIWSR